MKLPWSRTVILLAWFLSAAAHAGVVYSGLQNIAIPIDFNGIYLDFDDGSDATSFDTNIGGVGSTGSLDPNVDPWDFNLFFGGAAIATSDTLQPVTTTASTNSDIVRLGAYDTIGPASTFPPIDFSGSTGHMGTDPDQWNNGDIGYIGFRIQPSSFDTNIPSGPVYGYMRVRLQDDGTPGEIIDWAWQDDGTAITIPEPATAGVAAFFLSIFVLLPRRRRRVAS